MAEAKVKAAFSELGIAFEAASHEPVTTVEAAAAYRERILGAAASRGVAAGAFEPLMTLYLTDSTTPEQIKAAHASGIVKAVKLYPAGATTNSASGVTDYAKVAAPLAASTARARSAGHSRASTGR